MSVVYRYGTPSIPQHPTPQPFALVAPVFGRCLNSTTPRRTTARTPFTEGSSTKSSLAVDEWKDGKRRGGRKGSGGWGAKAVVWAEAGACAEKRVGGGGFGRGGAGAGGGRRMQRSVRGGRLRGGGGGGGAGGDGGDGGGLYISRGLVICAPSFYVSLFTFFGRSGKRSRRGVILSLSQRFSKKVRNRCKGTPTYCCLLLRPRRGSFRASPRLVPWPYLPWRHAIARPSWEAIRTAMARHTYVTVCTPR